MDASTADLNASLAQKPQTGELSEASRKLFFALWPDAVTRIALDAVASTLHAAWGGRKVNQAGLHLTLAYLGDTSAIRLNPLRQLSGSITGQPFSLILKRPGCWPHNRVGWYGPADTPPALTQLVADFRRVLQAGEFPVDDQPYVPHVTLLRNARCGMPPHCPSVNWHASSFVLLASRARGVGGYELLNEWPLSHR